MKGRRRCLQDTLVECARRARAPALASCDGAQHRVRGQRRRAVRGRAPFRTPLSRDSISARRRPKPHRVSLLDTGRATLPAPYWAGRASGYASGSGSTEPSQRASPVREAASIRGLTGESCCHALSMQSGRLLVPDALSDLQNSNSCAICSHSLVHPHNSLHIRHLRTRIRRRSQGDFLIAMLHESDRLQPNVVTYARIARYGVA